MAMSSLRRLYYRLSLFYWKVFQPTTVGVRILLIKNKKVVLVKHSYQTQWYIPGGGVRKRETYEEAIKREVKEEFDGTIISMKLFGVYTNFYEGKNDHIIIFASSNFKVGKTKSGEVEDIRQFSLNRLPSNISPGSKRRIAEYSRGSYSNSSKW